jgi:hypothetical protein
MTKIVIAPQTYLAPDLSGILAHCFDEVYLLRPPDLSPDQWEVAGEPPGVFKTLEPSEDNEDIGLDPGKLRDLMHQWETWVAGKRENGALETIKAGVRPPLPDQENSRAIKHQILGGAQPEEQPEKPPSASPGLVLNLAHLMEKKMAEIRSLAGRVDDQQAHMSELLGLDQGDAPPADFQNTAPGLLGSLGREMEDESLTAYRLQAWACLAPFESIKNLTPLTLSPQAALLLLARANDILGGKAVRSAAGVQNLLWPPVSLSMAGTSLAREALRLRLPAPEEAAGFKKALGMMSAALGQAPLSSDLLESLQEIGAAWLESGGPDRPGGRLGLMVFPGYTLAGLLSLMKGQASKPENPGASCPLWVLW